ncbi:MAG: putative membrane protein YfcA [Oceanicoccus sp.]|jgi:uncharacterized membrane protein YfcA
MDGELQGGLFSVLSSLISSFSGGGGSLILLSGLVVLFPTAGYLPALTITKVSAAILTSTSGWMHRERQEIDWRMILVLILSGLTGVGIGTYLVQYKIDEEILLKALPVLLFIIVIYLSFDRKRGAGKNREKPFVPAEYIEAGVFSLFMSLLSGMVAGMGPFFVAYFVIRFHTSFIQTIAYMMISGTVITVLQSSYLLWTVDVNLTLLTLVIFGSLIGAYFGTKFQYKMGNHLVKTAALLMMSAMGLFMIFT